MPRFVVSCFTSGFVFFLEGLVGFFWLFVVVVVVIVVVVGYSFLHLLAFLRLLCLLFFFR